MAQFQAQVPARASAGRTHDLHQPCRWMVLKLFYCVGLACLSPSPKPGFFCCQDPTTGCARQHYTYKIQKPYDQPLYKRYNFSHGVHSLWVYSDDKSFTPTSHTKPRTELRFKGVDYSSGVWQFDADMYIPSGSTGAYVTQIHPTIQPLPVSFILVKQGMLTAGLDVLTTDIYDKWIHLNIVHDADKQTVTYYLNGNRQAEASAKGEGPFYFKCGVYTHHHASHFIESRWTNITIWKC